MKTGTSWEEELKSVQPDVFMKKWMHDMFTSVPVRCFLISDRPDHDFWENYTYEGGIVFDRCRLVDFGENLSAGLKADMSKWISACKRSLSLRGVSKTPSVST
jgi:hypothetical protein